MSQQSQHPSQHQPKRFLRYLAPNLVTLASLLFGMLSIKSTVEGSYGTGAWFILLSVLTDKLDGFVARLVKGTSEFGVQLDSFADFLNFGVAPATLWYTWFVRQPELPFAEGGGRALLLAVCAMWLLAVTFRLARYNIAAEDPRTKHIFFGVPTTLAGGCLVSLFMAFIKYSDPQVAIDARWVFDEPMLLGAGARLQRGAWLAFPAFIAVGAVLMASTARNPKLGRTKTKALTIFIFGNVFAGYVLGFMRILPEYLAFVSFVWIAVSVVWGAVNKEVRSLQPAPLFPRVDPLPGMEPQRPEDDALLDDDEPDAVQGG